jgi:hypothetical protein
MEIKVNIKVLILMFMLSACTGDNEGFYQHGFEPCDSLKFERIRDYPSELDSVIRDELVNIVSNKFTLDSIILNHPYTQSNCELDSTEYTAQVFISRNTSSQIWIFFIKKRDWLITYEERLK